MSVTVQPETINVERGWPHMRMVRIIASSPGQPTIFTLGLPRWLVFRDRSGVQGTIPLEITKSVARITPGIGQIPLLVLKSSRNTLQQRTRMLMTTVVLHMRPMLPVPCLRNREVIPGRV